MARRASAAAVAIAALAVWLALAGCTRRNDAYCCTDPALCADVGGVLKDCPSGQLCDDLGAEGNPPHTCYPDPQAQGCARPGDCPATAPACVEGICVECDRLDHCAAARPRCDLDLHRCAGCAGPADCARFADAPVCGPGGACVACLPEDPPRESPACEGAAPVCGADGSCRRCADHRECASGACDLATGACVAPGQIAYADAAAAPSNAECTAAAPCRSIGAAVARQRPYVVLAPAMYVEDVTISDRTVTLIGFGATLRAQSNLTAGLTVSGLSGTVTVAGLELTLSYPGVACTGTAANATIALRVEDATIEDNLEAGVRATQCALAITRTRVTGNPTGGIAIDRSTYDVTNTLIDGNGNNEPWGGVDISSPRQSSGNRLAFNTIVGNRSVTSGFPGIRCAASSSVPPLHSNLVHGNTGSTGGVQVSGSNCAFTHSLINPAVDGPGNLTGDPAFTVAFRIGADSPARDAGNAADPVPDDLDRQPRDDGAPDIGADEYRP